MPSGYVFLDRDGVINVERGYINKKENIELIIGSAEAIKLLNRDFKVIVITNQSAIAQGLININDLKNIHDYLIDLLGERGAKLDAIYFCPHHPIKGNNPDYTKECDCRKPKTGLFEKAKRDFNIQDFSQYFLVGDTNKDMQAGKLVGCKTILVQTGHGLKQEPRQELTDYVVRDLYSAVTEVILDSRKDL